jgi:hypothetical protein
MYLDDDRLEDEAGEELASRGDFDGPLDVVPVSDPNIFSEAQRFAQIQAVSQRASAMPQLYNQRKVEERILETLKIPEANELLNPPMEPKEQNAINENAAATLGRPIMAFPEQDHIAHIKAHLSFLLSPALGMNPLIAPTFLPIVLNHLKEHIALWYVSSVVELSDEAMGESVTESMKELGKDVEARRALDRMLAEASVAVSQESGSVFEALPPVIQQAQQLLQSLQPQPVPDPRTALEQAKLQAQAQRDQQQMQLEQAKLQMGAAEMQQGTQLEAAKMQQQAALEQARMQLAAFEAQQSAGNDQGRLAQSAEELRARIEIEARRQRAEDERKAAELQTRLTMNSEDNETAMRLAAAEIASGEKVAVSTGTGINPNPQPR